MLVGKGGFQRPLERKRVSGNTVLRRIL